MIICNAFTEVSCQVDWDFWSALGTFSAAGAALWIAYLDLNQRTAEEHRRHLRDDTAAKHARDEARRLAATEARNVLSAADSIVAYRAAAAHILAQQLIYDVQFDALALIRSNANLQANILKRLLSRPGLSDGVLAAGTAADALAGEINSALALTKHGTEEAAHHGAAASIMQSAVTARMVSVRSDVSRLHYSLEASSAAAQIRAKYADVAARCKEAKDQQVQPPPSLSLYLDRY